MNLRISFTAAVVLALGQVGFSQIYSVGVGDGFSSGNYNPYLAIYSVGDGDGFSQVSLTQADNPYLSVYSVGDGDGFAQVSRIQADNPYLAFYLVGDGDGFSLSNYTQADNPYLAFYLVGNGDGFGSASVGGPGSEIALPIELISFKVYVQDNQVKLEWQTASETNNDYFTIEKSKTGQDWVTVTQVNGAGNSIGTMTYKTSDPAPYYGVSYYRLKQTDFDGKFSHSEIIGVTLEQNSTGVVVYPNPTHNRITIQADEHELSGIKIYNALGQDVTNSTRQLFKTGDSLVIELGNLPDGVYTVLTATTTNIVYKQ